ncbi:MAG: hypothetical protein RIS47_2109 [Bacteroidota bacterium]
MDIKKNFTKHILKPGPKTFTFAFFVLLSSILWFLSTLSQKYTDTVAFPVRYKNLPDKLALNNQLPTEIDLQIEALGYSLLYYKLTPNLEALTIDYQQCPLVRTSKTDSLSLYVLTNFLNDKISEQLGSLIQLSKIKPDTLYFSFTKSVNKKVPIRLSYDMKLKMPYRVKPFPSIIPDSVYISGSKDVIANINELYTEKLTFTKDNFTTQTINLIIPENVQCAQFAVELRNPIEKFTENDISIPLSIINCPNNIQLTPFPAYIRIRYFVGIADYNKISMNDFAAHLDYHDIKTSMHNRIRVHIDKTPQIVDVQEITPRKVEYILVNK